MCVATLCVDAQTVEAVKQAVVRKNGIFAGELPGYVRYDGDPLLLQKLQRAEVSVCVIDFDRDREQAVAAANSLQQLLHGRTTLIAVSAEAAPGLILEAMRAGCGEYLTKPVAADQFAQPVSSMSSMAVPWPGRSGNSTVNPASASASASPRIDCGLPVKPCNTSAPRVSPLAEYGSAPGIMEAATVGQPTGGHGRVPANRCRPRSSRHAVVPVPE